MNIFGYFATCLALACIAVVTVCLIYTILEVVIEYFFENGERLKADIKKYFKRRLVKPSDVTEL